MPSVVITGAAGFIYSHVARHFVEQGWDVTIADHFDMQSKGKNLVDILPRVQLLIGDLTIGALADRCAAIQADYLVHAAAYTHVDDAIIDPERFMLNNTLGTTRLLQALWQQQTQTGVLPRKILIVSTDEVYGPTPPGVFFDEDTPYAPSNAYAASKVGVEAIAQAFWRTHRFPLMIVRPCNTYGPGQFPNKVIPKFIGQIFRHEPITLYNDGQGSRDWLHVTDHARAVQTVLEHGLAGEAYNLGAGEEHTDIDLCTRILAQLEIMGLSAASVPATYVPGRPGHDRRYAMDCRKIRRLGWAPMVEFTQGFAETVAWNARHQAWWDTDGVHLTEDSVRYSAAGAPDE